MRFGKTRKIAIAMSNQQHNDDAMETPAPDFPTAVVRDARIGLLNKSAWMFLALTAACLVFALYLGFRSTIPSGELITIHFADGYGLKDEDALRYRGITIGQVEEIRLRDDLAGVDVDLRLRADGEAVAREGSVFWVERPQLSLARMSGLETVVGAKYVGVIPGAPDAPRANEFVGQENPPRLRQSSDVSVLVRFKDGNGIESGDAVKFRGVIVGEVSDVRLDENFEFVEVRAQLVDRAKVLAQTGTVFWVERPKVNFRDGIRGLETLVGGKYLAMMPNPSDGQPQTEFDGAEKPPANWQDWTPFSRIGQAWSKDEINPADTLPGEGEVISERPARRVLGRIRETIEAIDDAVN